MECLVQLCGHAGSHPVSARRNRAIGDGVPRRRRHCTDELARTADVSLPRACEVNLMGEVSDKAFPLAPANLTTQILELVQQVWPPGNAPDAGYLSRLSPPRHLCSARPVWPAPANPPSRQQRCWRAVVLGPRLAARLCSVAPPPPLLPISKPASAHSGQQGIPAAQGCQRGHQDPEPRPGDLDCARRWPPPAACPVPHLSARMTCLAQLAVPQKQPAAACADHYASQQA